MSRILIADDNDDMCEVLSRSLSKRGYAVDTAPDGAEAVTCLKAEEYDVLLADLRMPVLDGMELLKSAGEVSPRTIVIMITAYGTVEDAVNAMRHGAFDYVLKPFSSDEIAIKIEKAIEHRRLEEERRLMREEELKKRGGLICDSPAMQEVDRLIFEFAQRDDQVIVCGKSGTGKELVAREIHGRSARSEGPFVIVNCVALDPLVQELELFGCDRGVRDEMPEGRKGKMESAEGGTLFIEEVGELSVDVQGKLIEFLTSRKIRRLGSDEDIGVDVRIIASTSESLEMLAARGKFSSALEEAFKACSITLPELREREADIGALAGHFVDRYAAEFHKHAKLAPETLGMLKNYSWPGNVHELENVIARAVIVCKGDMILPSHLPLRIAGPISGVKSETYIKGGVAGKLDAIEKEVIRDALEKEDWNQSHAAARLGMKRTTLQYKIKKYGIEKP